MKRLLFLPLLAVSVSAQDLAREIVDAINSGDAATQKTFAAKFSRPGQFELLQRAFEESGGLEIIGPDRGALLVKTKRDRRTAVLFAQPDGFEIMPVPSRDLALEIEGNADDETITRAVRKIATATAARDDFSGVVLLARGDRILLHEAWGVADRNHDVAMEPLSKFQIASVGKMFTAVAIAQLVDAGKLRLDQTVLEMLPDYPNRDAAAKMQVRHLLGHSSGLGGLFDRPKYDRLHRYARETDLLPVFAAEPLSTPARARATATKGSSC